MADRFDLVVIGSGTAAQTVIDRVHEAGWRIAAVDHRPFGGTCALRGCDPKKMLVSGEEALDAARRMRGHGVEGGLRIDWPQLMAFKRGFTDPIPAKQAAHYHEMGVETLHGMARFVGPEAIEVDGRRLEFEHAVIATGAAPVPLGIPGEELVATSDEFMELEALPRRIALIGGGYIAAEFSHLAARAGAEVTILQRGPRLLTHFDPDLVGWLMPRFEALGIRTQFEAEVRAVERADGGLRIRAARDGREIAVAADLVVHAAGRAPDLSGLDLRAAEVAEEKGRLTLTPHLQSVSNPRVYAAGDAAEAGPPLTPVSTRDARAVAANLLEGARHTPNYRGVPSVVFTLPTLAAVGLSEEAARREGRRFRVSAAKTPGWFTARRRNESVYGHKVLIEEGAGAILGAHLVGPGAEETINLFALAIRHDLTAEDLKSAVFAYPTSASDVGYML
jgi:glutathione reductase (NADPH)